MVPFQIDPSWYEHYWLTEHPPRRGGALAERNWAFNRGVSRVLDGPVAPQYVQSQWSCWNSSARQALQQFIARKSCSQSSRFANSLQNRNDLRNNVRFWHKAAIPRLSSNVRYWV